MKVFISWSGDISHEVAEVLYNWLPHVIQSLEPYISSKDTPKGALWIEVLSEKLKDSSYGILCVTKDNMDALWLNFEAGALSNSVDQSRVAPFLFGIKREEIKEGPITQFQSTIFDENDIRNLLDSLNTAEGTSLLDKSRLDNAFNTWWPKLKDKLNEIKVLEPGAKEGELSSQEKDADTSIEKIEELARETEKNRKDIEQLMKKLTAETAVQEASEASLVDRAVVTAVRLQGQGKIDEAVEKWRAIANIAEDDQLQARAWFSVAYLLSQGEGADLKAVVDVYTKAIGLNSGLAAAYNNRGNAMGRLRLYEEAIADYDQAIKLDQNDAISYHNRGGAKNKLRLYEEAIADYDQAIELDQNNAVFYHNRGGAKKDLGRYEEAIADYSQAIKLNPTYAAAYNNRGYAIIRCGQPEAALADLDRAIELNPTYAAAYDSRGYAMEKLGRIDEARADYQQSLALAQAAGNENIVAQVKLNLSRLDSNAAP